MKCSILIIILWCICFTSTSQDFTPTRYVQKDGLKSPSIFCLFKDSKGYLWLGTNTGVARFDGKDFDYFEIKNGLKGYSVYQIREDSKGRVWFLTDTGQPNYYIDGEIHSPETSSYLDSLSSESFLYGFLEDKSQNIWLGSFNTGFKALKNDGSIYTSKNFDLPKDDQRASHIWEYLPGQLIVTSTSNVVALDLESEKVLWQKKIFGVEGSFMRAIRYSPTEILAFSGKSGVIFDLVTKEISRRVEMGNSSEVIQVRQLINGEIIVCTREGMYILKDFSLVPHFLNKDLKKHAVSDVILDKNGVYWLSTLNNGLLKFENLLIQKDPRFKSITEPIHSFNTSPNEELFIGTQSSNYYIFNENLEKRQFENSKSEVVEIEEIGKDSLLIISQNKAYFSHQGNSFSRGIAIKGYLHDKQSDQLFLSHGNGVTITTLQHFLTAISEYDDYEFRNYFKSNIKEIKQANGVAQWQKGIFIGTKNGLYYFKNDTLKLVETRHLSESTYILKTLGIKDGKLILATLGEGVIVYDVFSEMSTSYSTIDGLSDDFIIDIMRDRDGMLWIKQSKGLSSVDFTAAESMIRNYGETDGLENVVINTLGEYRGNILLGTNNGILSFDKPSLYSKANIDQKLYFESYTTSKGTFPIKDSTITVPSNEQFTLQYNLISFKLGSEISYFYRIKEASTKWIESSSELISYSGLKQGTYTLQIYAENNLGTKSEKYEIVFIVENAWYNTSLAWFTYVCLTGLIVLGLFTTGILNFNKNELLQILNKLKNIRKTEVTYPPISIKTIDGSYVKLQAHEIQHISASGNYVEFHSETDKYVVRNTLKNVAADLSHISFIKRIHRSHLINKRKVKSHTSNNVFLTTKSLPIGPNYLHQLKES